MSSLSDHIAENEDEIENSLKKSYEEYLKLCEEVKERKTNYFDDWYSHYLNLQWFLKKVKELNYRKEN